MRATHTNPALETYVLVTGDGHFRAAAAFIRQRLQKTVVVAGYADSINRLLQQSASKVEIMDLVPFQALTDQQIADLIRFVDSAEQAKRIVTFTSTARYFLIPGMGEDAVRAAVGALAAQGVFLFREEPAPDGRTVRRMYLNKDCDRVRDSLNGRQQA